MKRMGNVRTFDENISQTVNAGVTAILYTFVVPHKCILRILKFANYTDTPAAVGTGLTWSIQRNGVGIRPYNNLLDIIGLSYQPEIVNIEELKGSDVLTLVTVNGTGGNVISGVRIVFELEDVR